MKLTRGDIVINRSAGHVMYRYFIFTHKSDGYIHGIEFVGRLQKNKYHIRDLEDIHHDGEPVFKIVGHSEAFDVMKSELRTLQKKELSSNP